jgi:preprotein translocase subunit SecG
MQILINVLIVFLVIDSLLLVLAVLMQRPKSEGLGVAFGGGVTEGLFGAGTTDFLVRLTIWLTGIFFGLCLLLVVLIARSTSRPVSADAELAESRKAAAKPKPSLESGKPPTPPAAKPTAPAATTPAPAAKPTAPAAATPAPAAKPSAPAASPSPTQPVPVP